MPGQVNAPGAALRRFVAALVVAAELHWRQVALVRTYAKHILQLDEVVHEVAQDLLPNRLCQYLFELSQKFNQFYDRCSVLQAAEPQRTSRLLLCDLTARTPS